ncbi:hydrogenase expression/formation C-terminal domain-containing protein [Caenispirillum salinarum]|uniref:hydrogenase expression/formation protein n=1 Tax=Caenispirillum salinarum TaxID=859058 RepID=UPI00384E6F88
MIGPSMGDALLSLRSSDATEAHRRRSFTDEDIAGMTGARAVFDALTAAVASHRIGHDVPVRVALDGLSADEHRLVEEVLGEGEVLVKLPGEVRVQESVMAGIWRVADPATGARWLEVADIPSVVRGAVCDLPSEIKVPAEDRIPRGAINVRPVLGELRDHAADRADDPAAHQPHEVNLTLLPMTSIDLMVLETALNGDGPVDILSRGYGNCRVVSTGIRNVWRLMYFNADDKMILHVLQVGDVPAAALAAQEDLADTAERLSEILGAYYT